MSQYFVMDSVSPPYWLGRILPPWLPAIRAQRLSAPKMYMKSSGAETADMSDGWGRV